eukprot:4776484-Pyramimonas_sp.AAC.1
MIRVVVIDLPSRAAPLPRRRGRLACPVPVGDRLLGGLVGLAGFASVAQATGNALARLGGPRGEALARATSFATKVTRCNKGHQMQEEAMPFRRAGSNSSWAKRNRLVGPA